MTAPKALPVGEGDEWARKIAREIVNTWLPQPVTAKAAMALTDTFTAALVSTRSQALREGAEKMREQVIDFVSAFGATEEDEVCRQLADDLVTEIRALDPLDKGE